MNSRAKIALPRVGVDPVGAHHHQAGRALQVVVDGPPERDLCRAQLWAPADVRDARMVRRAQDVAEAAHVGQHRAAGARAHGDGLGPVGSPTPRGCAPRWCPGPRPTRSVPSALAPLADPPQRVEQSVGMVLELHRREALGAEAPARHRVVRVALHLHHLPVPHVHQHAAAAVAEHAGGADDGGVRHPAGLHQPRAVEDARLRPALGAHPAHGCASMASTSVVYCPRSRIRSKIREPENVYRVRMPSSVAMRAAHVAR